MPAPSSAAAWNGNESLLQVFAVSEKANQLLLSNIPDAAWRASPGKTGRTIAEIFCHINNVRLMWLKAAAKGTDAPEKLDQLTCTREEVATALAQSAQACSKLIESALATPDARIKNFRPNAIHFVGYLISHDAHHRGQIGQLARQAGHPLSKQANFALWEWGTLAKSI